MIGPGVDSASAFDLIHTPFRRIPILLRSSTRCQSTGEGREAHPKNPGGAAGRRVGEIAEAARGKMEADMAPIRVVIADDHALLREGTSRLLGEFPDLLVVGEEVGEFSQQARRPLAEERTSRLLGEFPDLLVVGEAADGVTAVELARTLRPDVVILDIRLPRLNGIEATRQIVQDVPEAKVLILTAYDDDDYVTAVMDAGALGYLLKTAPGRDLVEAVRAVSRGEPALHPAIARKVATLWRRKTSGGRAEPHEPLTPRESEVLRLLAQGWRNKQIAQHLGVSVRTVEAHLNSIYLKLGVSTRTQAVMRALSHRLLDDAREGADSG